MGNAKRNKRYAQESMMQKKWTLEGPRKKRDLDT